MPNVVRFPGEKTVKSPHDPGDEPVRWAIRCECGSPHFQVYAYGEIACSVCDAVPHDENRGEARAHWTGEVTLLQRVQTIRFEDPA